MELPSVAVSQSPEEKFREYLASRPRAQRYTNQQREMVRFIFNKHEHFDADELIRDMEASQLKPKRATVYRTLNKLVDAGLLRRIEIGPRMKYEHDYGYPQHEHMVCQECGAMIEFQAPAIAHVLQEICRQHHFQSTGHTFVIRGTCAACNRARMTKRRLDLV